MAEVPDAGAGLQGDPGASLVVVQKTLRHANYQLTADTYIHLSEKMVDETNGVFDHF
jgi:integrase